MDDRRIKKINDLLQEELGWLITTELKDPRLSLLLTVTKVISNKDLKSAKIMVFACPLSEFFKSRKSVKMQSHFLGTKTK